MEECGSLVTSVVVRTVGAEVTAAGGTVGRYSALLVGGASGEAASPAPAAGLIVLWGDVPASLGDLALLLWDNLCDLIWHRAGKWLQLLSL